MKIEDVKPGSLWIDRDPRITRLVRVEEVFEHDIAILNITAGSSKRHTLVAKPRFLKAFAPKENQA